jgi:hypothetical protein
MSIRMPLVLGIASVLASGCAGTSLDPASDEQMERDTAVMDQALEVVPAPPPPCMFMECDFEGCRIFEAPCPPDPPEPPSEQ